MLLSHESSHTTRTVDVDAPLGETWIRRKASQGDSFILVSGTRTMPLYCKPVNGTVHGTGTCFTCCRLQRVPRLAVSLPIQKTRRPPPGSTGRSLWTVLFVVFRLRINQKLSTSAIAMDPERVRAYLQAACAGLGFDVGEVWWTSSENGSSTVAAIGEFFFIVFLPDNCRKDGGS